MYKYKVTYTINGAIHRPPYDGTSEVWVNYPTELEDSLYRKLKHGPFFEITRDDVRIICKEYLSLLDQENKS